MRKPGERFRPCVTLLCPAGNISYHFQRSTSESRKSIFIRPDAARGATFAYIRLTSKDESAPASQY
jgi:hypothetical protein